MADWRNDWRRTETEKVSTAQRNPPAIPAVPTIPSKLSTLSLDSYMYIYAALTKARNSPFLSICYLSESVRRSGQDNSAEHLESRRELLQIGRFKAGIHSS
jgi:hypothetical protein